MADEIAKLDVVVELDDRPLKSSQKTLEKAFRSIGNVGANAGKQFQTAFTGGAATAGKAITNMARRAERDLNGVSKALANVKNIAQGIVFAQTFYSGLNAIKGIASESWEFSKNVEAASRSFEILLQNADQASQAVEFLQDFAARTTFSFETATQSAKTLLAYGFEFKNLAYLMETIGDATAAMGDPEAFNRISRALGQMLAKGTVKAEELRQLTEAGIPAAQILAKTLGLSAQQVANIGDYSISSEVAVNALLQGMEQRFAGLNKTMATTMVGLQNNIRETLSMIGKGITEPLYNSVKGVLVNISNTLDAWLAGLRQAGRGGLVNAIFSPGDAALLRTLAANLIILKNAFVQLMQGIAPVAGNLLRIGTAVGNVVLPAISALLQMVTGVVEFFFQWEQSTYLVAAAMGALLIVNVVAKSMAILHSTSVALIRSWQSGFLPVILAVAAALATLMAIFGRSEFVAGKINQLGDSFANLFGIGGADVLQPQIQKVSKGIEGMNEKIVDSSKFIKDVEDQTKKAGKAAKNALAAFDEVYTIPEEAAAAGSLLDPTLMPSLNLDNFDMPDFGGLTDAIAEQFKFKLDESFKKAGIGAVIGGALGGIIGGILGGPAGFKIGAAIGALAGGIAGLFWDDLSKAFQNATLGAGLGAAIGAALGALVGQPLIGAAIGAVVGSLAGYFWDKWQEAFAEHPGITAAITGAAGGIGAAIGLLLGGPMGAIIGGAIGLVVGGIAATFWEDFKKAFDEHPLKVSALLGAATAIGAAIGFMVGGPLGAVIGGGIGLLTSYIGVSFWDKFKEQFGETGARTGALTVSATAVGAAIGMMVGGPLGAAIGGGIGALVGWIGGYFWDDIKKAFEEHPQRTPALIGGAAGIGAALGLMVGGPMGALIGGGIGALVGFIGGDFWDKLKAAFDENPTRTAAITGIGGFIGGAIGLMLGGPAGALIGAGIGTLVGGIVSSFWDKLVEGFNNIKKKFTDLIDNLFKDTKAKVDVEIGAYGPSPKRMIGHANGGIFNREHIANFAEGNKAEAIIPLENERGMAPFVSAVADGILNGLAPLLAQSRGAETDDRRPLYVGTLIADERGLRELNRKMQLIEEGESRRTFQGGDLSGI